MPLTGTPKSLKGMPGAYFPRIYIFFYVALNFNLDFPKIFKKIIFFFYTPDNKNHYYDIQAILRKAPKGAINQKRSKFMLLLLYENVLLLIRTVRNSCSYCYMKMSYY